MSNSEHFSQRKDGNKRKGIYDFLKVFGEKRKAMLIAPTGYGKTLASIDLLRTAKDEKISSGLIHVVPLRSLVQQIYEQKFKDRGFRAGYQSQDRLEEGWGKSPFFLRELVATTLDSFIMNLYKVPVAEVEKVFKENSMGHYYVPLASIFSSTVVFDEAHMYLGEGDESYSIEMVHAAVRALSKLDVPLVVETATMNTAVIENIANLMAGEGKVPLVYITCDDNNSQLKKLNDMEKVSVLKVCDEEYESKNSIEWNTEIIDDEKIFDVIGKSDEGDVILIVRNTVKKAVETYQSLKDKGYSRIVLVHGRLSLRDREKALESMKKVMENGGIIVSTQVIEAGVESNASLLITDAAPLENIAQRAGRLCREHTKIFDRCREKGASIYLLKPSEEVRGKIDVYDANRVKKTMEEIERIVKEGKAIDWRLFGGDEKKVSFVEILERIDPPKVEEEKEEEFTKVMEKYLTIDSSFDLFKRLLDYFGKKGFFRESFQVRLAIPQDGSQGEPYDFVDVDLRWLIEFERRKLKEGKELCLEYDAEGRAFVLGEEKYFDDKEWKYVRRPSMKLNIEWLRKGWSDPPFMRNLKDMVEIYAPKIEESELPDYARYFAFLLRKDCYERGMGLIE
jgi:CRISPR-associated endonuclease/helicase Cas3